MGKRLALLMIFFDLPLMLTDYCMMWIGAGPEYNIEGVSESLSGAAMLGWLATMLVLPLLIVGYNFWHRRWGKGLAVFGAALFLFAGSIGIYGVRLGLVATEQAVPERQSQVSSRYVYIGSFENAKQRLDEDTRLYLEERGRRTYLQAAEELRWEALPDVNPELLELAALQAKVADFEGLFDPAHPELGYKATVRLELPNWRPFDIFQQFMRGFVDMPEREAELNRQWQEERQLQIRNAERLGGLTFTEAEQLYQVQLAAALWRSGSEGWLAEQAAAYDEELRLAEPSRLAAPAQAGVWQLVDEREDLFGASYPGLYQAELLRWEPLEGGALPQGVIAKLMQGEEPESMRPVERLRIIFHIDRNDAYQGRYYTNARYVAVLHEDI